LNLERHLQTKEKNMIAKKILLTLITAAVLALATTGARAQSDEPPVMQEGTAGQPTLQSGGLLGILAQQKKAIAGSWLATITIPGGPSPKALFTFTEDGNVISPAQGGVGTMSVFTPAHGAWTHLGGRSFGFTAISLVYSPTTGAFTGLFKLRGTITLDGAGNVWSGSQKNELRNPAGGLVFSVESTAQAERIKVEPLP
jgi:hypothetical protein